jgi:hypothetical protein
MNIFHITWNSGRTKLSSKNQNIFRAKNKKRNGKNKTSVWYGNCYTAINGQVGPHNTGTHPSLT